MPANTFNWTTTAQIQCNSNDTIGFYINQQSGATQQILPLCLGVTLISQL
jgi:hypothetical protein